MKYINLENDFEIDREKQPEIAPNYELTIIWLTNGMDNGFKAKGLTSDARRIRARIMDKFDKVIKEKATFLEINPIEYKFMVDAFNAGTASIQEAKWITIAENSLLNATDTSPVISKPVESANNTPKKETK